MAKLVSEGRKREFADFGFDGDEIPNPEDPEVFKRSKLNWAEVHEGEHEGMYQWVKELIRIRRTSICLNDGDRGHLRVTFSEPDRSLRMDRGQVSVVMNFGKKPVSFDVSAGHRLLLALEPELTKVEDGKVSLPPIGFAVFSAEEAAW